MNIKVAEQKKVVDTSRGRVVISPNPIKVSERLNQNGDVIDPRTKMVIRKAEDNL